MTTPTLSNVDRPLALGFGLALNDRLFRLAVGPGRELNIVTAPQEAPKINTVSSAEEAVAEAGLTFARSQFEGGEGLFRAHTEGAAADRYWDSKNVEVSAPEPGEFPVLRLLHATSVIETSASTGLRMAYDETAGSLYMCEGAVLRRSDNPTVASPTFADDDPDGATGEASTIVHDVAVLGDETYAVVDDGIHRKSSGTWTHWGNNPASTTYARLWAVKGRIVASDGRSLYEVTASGAAPGALKTLAPGVEWTSVADGGSHILAAATDGYVYAFSTDSGSMALVAQTLFEGEAPRSVGQTQGVVGVGTGQSNIGRLWVGELDSSGHLTGMRVVRQWGTSGASVDQAPRRVVGTRDALYVGVPDGTDTYLWRYDVTTDGVSRNLTLASNSGAVPGLLVIDDRLFASVDGAGVYREATTYASEGWLISPLGDFYTPEHKSWVGARLDTGDLNSGMAVELWRTTDPDDLGDESSSTWVRITRRDSGTGDPGEHSMSSVVLSRYIAGMVKLTPSTDATQSPTVRAFSFRAFVTSGEEDVLVEAPVNVSDQIERHGRHRVRVPGLGRRTYESLSAYEGKPVTAELFRPALTVRGLVEEVATPIRSITERGSVTMVSLVRIRGRRVGSASATSGAGPFGTYHLFGETPTFGEVE